MFSRQMQGEVQTALIFSGCLPMVRGETRIMKRVFSRFSVLGLGSHVYIMWHMPPCPGLTDPGVNLWSQEGLQSLSRRMKFWIERHRDERHRPAQGCSERSAGLCAELPAAAFSRPKRLILLLIPRDMSGKANQSVSVTWNGKERY